MELWMERIVISSTNLGTRTVNYKPIINNWIYRDLILNLEFDLQSF